MPTKATNITADNLITEYAEPIADAVGLDHADYPRTADGLATLLRDAADALGSLDQSRDWLEEAADDLNAVARLGDDGPKTQELLKWVDNALYEAKSDLALG
ncbi:hypothetical protein JL475_00320 [Streptomyces sp. M2CJ-2]|uniref:hypothetical protein n=1 Tax=Streptomyces sp. M2CJ-2 TaxID=2803948 RepID=UPI0019204B59|nr:hypothetical protein [Streptomyces sp. M2CJ-2]MBL3664490.1 hypothetical protein [Streptomyces sp. M2CJ-2]